MSARKGRCKRNRTVCSGSVPPALKAASGGLQPLSLKQAAWALGLNEVVL